MSINTLLQSLYDFQAINSRKRGSKNVAFLLEGMATHVNFELKKIVKEKKPRVKKVKKVKQVIQVDEEDFGVTFEQTIDASVEATKEVEVAKVQVVELSIVEIEIPIVECVVISEICSTVYEILPHATEIVVLEPPFLQFITVPIPVEQKKDSFQWTDGMIIIDTPVYKNFRPPSKSKLMMKFADLPIKKVVEKKIEALLMDEEVKINYVSKQTYEQRTNKAELLKLFPVIEDVMLSILKMDDSEEKSDLIESAENNLFWLRKTYHRIDQLIVNKDIRAARPLPLRKEEYNIHDLRLLLIGPNDSANIPKYYVWKRRLNYLLDVVTLDEHVHEIATQVLKFVHYKIQKSS